MTLLDLEFYQKNLMKNQGVRHSQINIKLNMYKLNKIYMRVSHPCEELTQAIENSMQKFKINNKNNFFASFLNIFDFFSVQL